MGTTYQSYEGQPLTTNLRLALTLPQDLPRGIGLAIDEQTGHLLFLGDPWDHRACFQEIQQALVQNYVVLAHGAALRRMKAQVSTQIVGQHIVLTGVFA